MKNIKKIKADLIQLKDNSEYYWIKKLKLPLTYNGSICDGNGMTLIYANRESGTTPLMPSERDSLLKLTMDVLNQKLGTLI